MPRALPAADRQRAGLKRKVRAAAPVTVRRARPPPPPAVPAGPDRHRHLAPLPRHPRRHPVPRPRLVPRRRLAPPHGVRRTDCPPAAATPAAAGPDGCARVEGPTAPTTSGSGDSDVLPWRRSAADRLASAASTAGVPARARGPPGIAAPASAAEQRVAGHAAPLGEAGPAGRPQRGAREGAGPGLRQARA